MRCASPLTLSSLIGVGIIAIVALAAGPARACPYGSQFFAWGGAGGCVKDGAQVMKCFLMPKSCPSGWSQEHQEEQGVWCCPPPPKATEEPNQPTINETCTWNGTAPFCKGRCAPGELARSWSSDGEGTYPHFGASCFTGGKVYCCRLTFPNR